MSFSNSQIAAAGGGSNKIVLRTLTGTNWIPWEDEFLDICPSYGLDGHAIMEGVDNPFVKPVRTPTVTYSKAVGDPPQFVDEIRAWNKGDDTALLAESTQYIQRQKTRGNLWQLMRSSTDQNIKTKTQNLSGFHYESI
jgi:hypothetical protein